MDTGPCHEHFVICRVHEFFNGLPVATLYATILHGSGSLRGLVRRSPAREMTNEIHNHYHVLYVDDNDAG